MSYQDKYNPHESKFQELKEQEKFLRDSIRYKNRRLRELQLKEAKYGIDTPAAILIEITDLKQDIESYQAELDEVLIQIKNEEKDKVTISTPSAHSLETQIKVPPPAVPRPINLSFDGPITFGMPMGWFNSQGFVSNVSTEYEIDIVAHPDGRRGACVRFRNFYTAEDEFGSLMQRCLARSLAGKVVRFEGEIKTSELVRWAGLWLRADGEKIPGLLFDNMNKNPITGSTPWKNYSIEAHLPQETVWLNYGILLVGRGTIWADNFRLRVWKEEQWLDV